MGGKEEIPDFRDEKLSVMRRVAAWLATQVGEGNTFTKLQLSEAFPGVDVARRLRELRSYEWELDVARGITAEWRLVKIGLPVWDPKVMGRSPSRLTSAGEREAAFAHAGYQCALCGIGAGEEYPDLPEAKARLRVRRVLSLSEGGDPQPYNLRVVCSRCDEPRVDDLVLMASKLAPLEKAVFASWMAVGERSLSPLDRLWELYRRLQPQDRARVAREVATAVQEELWEDILAPE